MYLSDREPLRHLISFMPTPQIFFMRYCLLYYDNLKNSIVILLQYYRLFLLHFQIFPFFKYKNECLKTVVVLHINQFWSHLSDHRINNSNHTIQGNIKEREANDISSHFCSLILTFFFCVQILIRFLILSGHSCLLYNNKFLLIRFCLDSNVCSVCT